MTTPDRLLELGKQMLSRVDPATAGLWPLAAAFLGRQALESSIADTWRQDRPEMLACPTRAQMLALAEVVDNRDLVARARHTWTALSRACHHHTYELPPTAAELAAWLDDAETVVRALGVSA